MHVYLELEQVILPANRLLQILFLAEQLGHFVHQPFVLFQRAFESVLQNL